MKQLINDFRDYQVNLGKSERTIVSYVEEVELFTKEFIGEADKLELIEQVEFAKQWLEQMNTRYSAGTINKKKNAISVFGKYLVLEGIIKDNAFAKIDKVKNNNKKIEVYSNDEIHAIFEYIDNKIKNNDFKRKIDRDVYITNKCAIKIMYKSALRLMEVVSIEMNDFNLEEGNKFYIHGKGGKGKVTRFNSFNKEERALVEEYLNIRNNIKIKEGNEKYLFISPISKSKITEASLRKFLNKILDELNIETSAPCHNLRHLRATELIAKDVPVKKVSQYLGHSSERITEQIYIHQDESVMNELSEL